MNSTFIRALSATITIALSVGCGDRSEPSTPDASDSNANGSEQYGPIEVIATSDDPESALGGEGNRICFFPPSAGAPSNYSVECRAIDAAKAAEVSPIPINFDRGRRLVVQDGAVLLLGRKASAVDIEGALIEVSPTPRDWFRKSLMADVVSTSASSAAVLSGDIIYRTFAPGGPPPTAVADSGARCLAASGSIIAWCADKAVARVDIAGGARSQVPVPDTTEAVLALGTGATVIVDRTGSASTLDFVAGTASARWPASSLPPNRAVIDGDRLFVGASDANRRAEVVSCSLSNHTCTVIDSSPVVGGVTITGLHVTATHVAWSRGGQVLRARRIRGWVAE